MSMWSEPFHSPSPAFRPGQRVRSLLSGRLGTVASSGSGRYYWHLVDWDDVGRGGLPARRLEAAGPPPTTPATVMNRGYDSGA
jgi:hypothetical protein